jgi:type VI secretion system secreted protein Hcp
MAFDSFLYFADAGVLTPVGESQDDSFKPVKAFEIKSFRFGGRNKPTIGSQSAGGGAGKAELETFEITKDIDSGSPTLFAACVQGQHFPKAYLALRKSGQATGTSRGTRPQVTDTSSSDPSERIAYLVFTFSFVFVSEITWDGRSGDDVPTETVKFAYGAFRICYQKQDNTTGRLLPPAFTAEWSQVLNQPTLAVV